MTTAFITTERHTKLAQDHRRALREQSLRARLAELEADDAPDHEEMRRIQIELSVLTKGRTRN
jgi:hypothetical protein